MVRDNFDAKFPERYEDIRSLKGVGDYTASAIASFAFNEVTAVVDGNVYRVLSRYFGVETAINSTVGIKEFKALAQSLIDEKEPANYNQAIMEFGAIQCKPKKPLCMFCPLSESCVALQKNLIEQLPVKEKKIKVRKRYFNFLVTKTDDNKTILLERKGKGIWQGLYQFPLIESDKNITKDELIVNEGFVDFFPNETTISLFNKKEIVHKLSHQHLYTQFWIVETSNLSSAKIEWTTIENYPVPVLIANFLKDYQYKSN